MTPLGLFFVSLSVCKVSGPPGAARQQRVSDLLSVDDVVLIALSADGF